MLGLGEGELQVLGQGAGEVVAAQRDRPLPDDLAAVGDDQVRVVGADVEGDDALLLAARPRRSAGSSPCGAPPCFEQVVGDEVAQGQRGHLHDVDLDVDVLEVLQVAVDHVALHGEQADLRLHGEAVGDRRRAPIFW